MKNKKIIIIFSLLFSLLLTITIFATNDTTKPSNNKLKENTFTIKESFNEQNTYLKLIDQTIENRLGVNFTYLEPNKYGEKSIAHTDTDKDIKKFKETLIKIENTTKDALILDILDSNKSTIYKINNKSEITLKPKETIILETKQNGNYLIRLFNPNNPNMTVHANIKSIQFVR